ncbi:MAG: pyridoxamine 5'-phosphate oxidase family protein [Deltaproteobacteria bacterium]|nr:pyridoxamine 5'-phosphate oxidase family protein [Deltaproteobacteria bacterium]
MLADLKDVKDILKDLFDSQTLAVLATQGDGQPYTNLVAFVSSHDLQSLFFATGQSTRKFSNLSAEPMVSMLVDNRANNPSDFRWAKAVTVTGKAEKIDKEKEVEITETYLNKHPHLRDFLASPSCVLIRIRVETYYLVTRFKDVMEIHMRL